jgi:hypothetical protein
MEAPLGILFLKKAELYNLVERLDKQAAEIYDKVKDKNTGFEILSSWPIEKNILMWSYHGHKHLGTAIEINHFRHEIQNRLNKHCKLKDWELCENNDLENNEFVLKKEYAFISNKNNLKKINTTNVRKVFENMVIRGFADVASYKKIKEDSHKKEIINITLNREGLLLGEVIYNVKNRGSCVKRIYWIYSRLMDYGGAWILLILFIIAIASAFFTNFWNMFSQLITWLIDIW